MRSAEDVVKAFRDFGISRKKFELFSSEFQEDRLIEKGMSFQKFHYIMKFAQEKGRITPAQKRELERVAERLEKIEGMDLKTPARVLREFLESVEVKTEGIKGR